MSNTKLDGDLLSLTSLRVNSTSKGGVTLGHNYNMGDPNWALKLAGNAGTPGGYLGQYINNGGFALVAGGSYYGGGPWTPDATTFGSVSSYNGTIQFHANTGLTAGTNFTPTERMRIDGSTGFVGIGIAVPTQPLDIRGATAGHLSTGRTLNVGASSEPGNWYVTAPNASGNSRIWSAVKTIVSVATEGAEASSISFSSQKAGALVEALRIDPNNNVGIGATNPSQKLQVFGGIFVTGPATLGATSSSGLMSMESPVFRNYVGDGSGWSWAFSKRAASVTTDLITIKDTGELLLGKTTVTANAGDIQLSKGLSFPATPVACSDPNTLDDYEEGTFTPVVNGSSTIGAGTYSPAAVGRYTKIGNRVFISGSVQWTAHTGVGNIIVAGFPFVQNNTANNRAVFSLVIDNLTYTGSSLVMIGVAGTATAALLNQSSNVADTSVPMDTTGSIFFSGHYDI